MNSQDSISPYFANCRKEILPALPESISSILEVGCGSGATLSWIATEWNVQRTVGLELDPSATKAAVARGLDARIQNIEEMTHEEIADLGKFDVVLALDVLEHLRDPWSFLRRLAGCIVEGGTFIATIPNVRHTSVIGNLLFRGEWHYEESGILDKTHLRFFTRKSAVELVAGEFSSVITMPIFVGRNRQINKATFSLLEDFLALQYLVVGNKVMAREMAPQRVP